MLYESYFMNSWGTLSSAGCIDADPVELCNFLRNDCGEESKFLGRIERQGKLVEFWRQNSLGIEEERNECLFENEEDAQNFERELKNIWRDNGTNH